MEERERVNEALYEAPRSISEAFRFHAQGGVRDLEDWSGWWWKLNFESSVKSVGLGESLGEEVQLLGRGRNEERPRWINEAPNDRDGRELEAERLRRMRGRDGKRKE